MFSFLTFNAALQDVKILGKSVYTPLKPVKERLSALPSALLKANPDVIFLQEMFHRELQDSIYKPLQKIYPYVTGLAKRGLKLRIGNELIIISKYPLSNSKLKRFKTASIEEKLFTSKGFYYANVTLPDIGNINLVNFHLTADGMRTHPESTHMNNIRNKQIKQMLEFIKPLNKVILAGDLNAGPHTSTINYEAIINSGFIDLFSEVGASGVTWDQSNPLVHKGKERHLPSQRIDHLFISEQLLSNFKHIDVNIVLDEHCVKTTNGDIPLSDHYGLMVALEC